jgi:hypothetical protein
VQLELENVSTLPVLMLAVPVAVWVAEVESQPVHRVCASMSVEKTMVSVSPLSAFLPVPPLAIVTALTVGAVVSIVTVWVWGLLVFPAMSVAK